MDVRKTISPRSSAGKPIAGAQEREYIFFKVKFNHFRDVSGSIEHAVIDREELEECECVLCLPDSYTEDGDETPLVISCHGAGGRVSEAENIIGGVHYAWRCVDAGCAVLDVCGSELHGRTLGCPEHLFAIYRAYRHAVKNYNLSERVFLAGASMGGQVAMNFINMFPSIVIAAGLIYPRLNMDGVTIDGHYCIGTWDKTEKKGNGDFSSRERIAQIFRFPTDEWCEENTIGFNPYRTRSFINCDGERVVIPPCPIKIWHGTADKTVDPVVSVEYVRAVRRGGCYADLRILDGIGHYVTDTMRTELRMWFDRFI